MSFLSSDAMDPFRDPSGKWVDADNPNILFKRGYGPQ